MFRAGPGNFDKLVEKATSHTNLETDYNTILQISDLIRQGDCPPKVALGSIKKKLFHANAHTVNYALLVLESVVKNCGASIHDEIATKAFMDTLRDVLKSNSNDTVRQKTLEVIQTWSHAFRSTPKYKAVQDMVTQLKGEGFIFPALKETDAMFAAESAPDWVDSPTCHRCRVQFGLVQRKHHCRACGNVFCSACSSKTTNIPKFGIEKEVRVCDTCYDQNKNRERASSPKVDTEMLPVEYLNSSLAQQKQGPKQKTAEELKEEDDFNLALALSQSEAEAKEKEKKRTVPSDVNNTFQAVKISSPQIKKDDVEPEDEELAKYLNRSHWEQRADRTKSASPDRRNSPPSAPQTPTHQLENGLSDTQLTDYMAYLRSQVEVFVNRMKSNSSRGRSITNDTSVQSLFMNITENHSRLLFYMSQQEESRVHFERLQDKLAQVKDAAAALADLRYEHQEKLRMEAEEAERVKQQQMEYKLQIMRRKKQEYLQQQRVMALQRLQDQEREMQLRKQHQQQHQQQYPGYMMGYPPQPQPAGYSHPAPPNFSQSAYIPPGYSPNVMHQGMGVAGQLAGPQSLPPNMRTQPLPQHPQLMPNQNSGPGLLPQPIQNPGPGLMHPSMPNSASIQSNMHTSGSIPHGLSSSGVVPPVMANPAGHFPPAMHNPSQVMQNHSMPPSAQNPGVMSPMQAQALNLSVHNAGAGAIPVGGPIQQLRFQQPHSMPQMQHSAYQGVEPAALQPPQQQYQPGSPPHQNQVTAELIRFD